MDWPSRYAQDFAPEWADRYPMKRTQHGVHWDLPHNEQGILLAQNIHYWDHGEWQPIDQHPIKDRSGGFGLPHRPSFRVHPGGFITEGRVTSGLRSMGVMRGDRYVPLWTAGAFKVEHGRFIQRVGPYDLEVAIGGGCSKTKLILPEMPDVMGDALALDYYAQGLVSPILCKARPFAKDAKGVEIDMRKWRTPHGKRESIPLATLADLAFPVILDPELCDGPAEQYELNGWSNFYATAHATSTKRWPLTGFMAVGQVHSNIPPNYLIARDCCRTDATAYAGTIQAADLRWACYTMLSPLATYFEDDFRFVQYDWSAYDPMTDLMRETVYDGIDAATAGAVLGSVIGYITIGCNDDATCIYGPWYALLPGDVAHLNSFNGLGDWLWFATRSTHDVTSTPPPAVHPGTVYGRETLVMTFPGNPNCPMCLRLRAGGGHVWLVGG